MSDSEEVCYRALSELVSQVDAKITVRKDPARPYVGLENIPSRGAHLTGWSLASSSISTNSIFQAGDILFGKLRPNLRKCVVAPFDGYCSTDILVLRANTGVDPSFAGKVLRTDQVGAAAEMTSVGTKMPRTSWKHLSEFEVFCPGLPEQSKIAKVLDILDTAIQETEAIIAKLKALKQGLLHDLLTRGIDANGEPRLPQSEAPHLYKESPLGWIPKSWECVRLVEKLGVFGGKRLPAGHAYAERPTAFKYLRVTDFYERDYFLDELESLYENTFNALERYEIRSGQLFISIAGSLGYVGVHRTEDDGAIRTILTENAARLIPLGTIEPEFVAQYMNSAMVQNQVTAEKGTGGGVPKLALFRIEQFWLAWPNEDEQVQIAGRLRAMTERIRDEGKFLRKLNLQKVGLMDDLLTGRVRVTPLLAE